MDARKICSQISEGKISDAKNHIITYDGEVFEPKVALSILITLCRTVSQSDNSSINDVFYLTSICCKNISGLKDSERGNFLLSLYHVIKYLCKHKFYCNVLILLEFIKQHCINKNFKSDVYNYYIVLFHNYILHNAKNLSGDILLKIVTYSLHFQILLEKNDFSSFVLKLKLYTSFFKYPSINYTHLTKFCSEIFNMLENVSATENQNDVKEIYTTLLNILNITIQHLSTCEDENFPHFVHDHFKQTCALMKKHCVGKEYIECIEILENLTQSVIKNFKSRTERDSEILTECGKKLKAVIRKRSTNPITVSTCSQISKIIRILFEYLQNCKNLWKEYFPISMHVELLRMMEVLGQYISKNSLDIEKCCGGCKFQTDIYHATVITSCTGILTLNSLRLNLFCPEEFHILSLRCMKMCCKFINNLKEEGCEKYVQIWRVVGTAAYNAAVILYRNKDYKYSRLYSYLFVKNVISLEGVENPELCFPNSLGASLHLHAVGCSFLKDRKKSMLYLSLTMLLCPEYKRKAFQTWIMLKSNDTDNEEGLKSLTVHHFLCKEQDSIKEIFQSYTYNQKDCEELLMDELLFYFENWQSKIPLSSVCNELCAISKNVIYRTRCFVMTWEKVIYLLDSNFIYNLEATIKMIADTTNINLKMCLSVLYYIQYQYKMNEIVDRNIADMNEAYIPLKSTPLQPYEEPPNPNDKCDIVPAFYNMKIDNLLKIYKILDNSLEIWDMILKDDKYKLDPKIVSDLKMGNFIKLTAYEYRMQYFIIKMLKTWILYYEFAKQFKIKAEIVTSIGFIIEYSDCNSETVKALEKEAEDLLLEFDKNDPVQLEIYLTYYINKSSGYYKNDLIEIGYSALRTAEIFLEEAYTENLKICKARILQLKTCYLLLPCANKILKHDANFMVTAQNSFVIVAEYYTTKTAKCPYLISILFEISLANGWMYKWLRLPREARCYTKESILLAQKFVLPIRTAQFLSLLSFTDLLDLQYSDCEVKLNGLTKMLCYASHVTYEKLPTQGEKIEDVKLESSGCESEMDNSISMIQTVLDLPASQKNINSVMMGSPELRRKSFVLPEFVKHSDDCECFMCSNCEYQKLILDAIHLEALLNLYQDVNGQGEEYFKGGLALYDKLLKKSKTFSYKSIRFYENEVIFPSVYTNIFQNYCTFLLDYSYFLTQRSAISDAKRVVDNIFKLICNVKHVNIYFWSELKVQKFNLFIQQEIAEEKSHNIENELRVPENVIQSTTPTNKISKTNIHLSVSPIDTVKKIKTFKKLTFDLSEDEKDERLQKTPESNKNLYFKFQTPAKTPAPAAPKIKIYTPKTVKSKRTASKTSEVPTLGNSELKKSVNKQLEERTKLLTEMLKAEKKPLPKECKNMNVLNVPLIKEPPKTITSSGIRKKLLDDMNDVTESVDKLSINNKEKTVKLKQAQDLKKAITTKPVEEKLKKYTRIKVASSSSSSDNSSDRSGTRKSTRTRSDK